LFAWTEAAGTSAARAAALGGGVGLEEIASRGALVLVEALVGVLVELLEDLAILLHHRASAAGKTTARESTGWTIRRRLLGEKGSEKDGGEDGV
jgi:hypothetical protein